MHDIVVVGIPLIAILAGILFGRADVKELRSEMNARFDKADARVEEQFNRIDDRFDKVDERFNRVDERFVRIEDHLARIDADLWQFYHLTGKLEARMDGLEKRN